MTGFGDRLASAIAQRGPVCVGIDPHAHLLEAWGLPDTAAGVEAFRGRHGMRVREVLLSLAACGLPVLGLWWLSRAAMATGLLGARAGALVLAAPLAGAPAPPPARGAWAAASGSPGGRRPCPCGR